MFVDSHAHLEMPQFDADRSDMLVRARDAGIETVFAIGSGTGPGSLDCAIQLARSAAKEIMNPSSSEARSCANDPVKQCITPTRPLGAQC